MKDSDTTRSGIRAGVDIGGTKLAVCLSEGEDGRGRPRLLARHSEPTVKTGAPQALAQQLMRLLAQACAEVGRDAADLAAVGVGACGPFVLKDGQIELATPNICGGLAELPGGPPNDWRSVPLEALLRPHWPALRIENDAVAALEAERRWGALQGLDHCAYLTWSTGVGVGLCVDGHVLRGKQGNAGHAGHSFVGDDAVDAWCGCGNRGDVEALVSGHAMAQRYGRPARALLEAAEAGDGAALLAVEQVCHTLGRLLYNLVVTLDLQRISLGGSVFVHHADLLLPRLDAQVRSRLPALTAGVELVAAGLGPEVGDYAALALVS